MSNQNRTQAQSPCPCLERRRREPESVRDMNFGDGRRVPPFPKALRACFSPGDGATCMRHTFRLSFALVELARNVDRVRVGVVAEKVGGFIERIHGEPRGTFGMVLIEGHHEAGHDVVLG